MLFEGTSRDIDKELAEIDPLKHCLNFGTILPDEEIIGEMNDFEKRAMIWMFLEVEKVKEELGQHETIFTNVNLETAKHLAEEAEARLEMFRFLQYRVAKSIVERFELGKLFIIKGNFQIVLTSKKNQEAEIKRLEEVSRVEVANIKDTTKSH